MRNGACVWEAQGNEAAESEGIRIPSPDARERAEVQEDRRFGDRQGGTAAAVVRAEVKASRRWCGDGRGMGEAALYYIFMSDVACVTLHCWHTILITLFSFLFHCVIHSCVLVYMFLAPMPCLEVKVIFLK